MSSGEVFKADKDFTKEVDAAIPEAEKLGAVRKNDSNSRTKVDMYRRAMHKPELNSCSRSRRRLARYGRLRTPRQRIRAHI